MKKIKFLSILTIAVTIMATVGCKKELGVGNPNQPSTGNPLNEAGLIALGQGGVYVNGFRDLKYGDGVFGLFWSGAMGFHELQADVIGAEAANAFLNQVGCPNKVTFTGGTILVNPNAPNTAYAFIRQINVNTQQGQNFTYYEWAYMYNMIAACNNILDQVDAVSFTGNSATKKATIKAWAYWWKGFAYSHIGSIYYAGIINNGAFTTNGNYVTKEAIINEATAQFDKCVTALTAATSTADYNEVLGKLIPDINQVGKGGILTTDMWKRNINTMKARNILVNKTVAAMTTADWSSVLALTNSGITSSDYVFTGRSNATGDLLSATSGVVSAKVQSTAAGGGTYKLSERWVQEFKAGDKRYTNNIIQSSTPWVGNIDRGNAFNTRFTLKNNGTGLVGVTVFASNTPGSYELYLAGNYEENTLMKAEATMYAASFTPASIIAGMALIDEVRNAGGAGLAPTVAADAAAAKEELRRERRIALAFRGLSFYDARRWGVNEPTSSRAGCNVIKNDGTLDNNATIVYGYLDYWDVPDNELAYNPAATGSAATKNPK